MNRFEVLRRGIGLAPVRFAFLLGRNGLWTLRLYCSKSCWGHHPGNEAAHIAFAADPIFQSVGSVAGWDGANWRLVGTGVLFRPDWVMLTGHELTTIGYTKYRFSLGNDLFQPIRGVPSRTLTTSMEAAAISSILTLA